MCVLLPEKRFPFQDHAPLNRKEGKNSKWLTVLSVSIAFNCSRNIHVSINNNFITLVEMEVVGGWCERYAAIGYGINYNQNELICVLIKGSRAKRKADGTETETGSSQLGSHHGLAAFRFYAFMISRFPDGGPRGNTHGGHRGNCVSLSLRGLLINKPGQKLCVFVG